MEQRRYGSNCKAIALRLISATLFLMAHSGNANAVSITEFEWAAWPDFCKAGFLASEWSAGSPFKTRMSADQVNTLRRIHTATVGIPGVHHFCVAMAYTNRVKNMRAGPKRTSYLIDAIGDFQYSFSQMSTDAPKYSLVTAYYGTALYRQGKRQQAMDMWNLGIRTKPASRESYLAMAEAFLDQNKAKDALEVLLRYESAKEYDAADAEAFLAHTYTELGRYDEATAHAEKAYKLGYPFPGLLKRIKRIAK